MKDQLVRMTASNHQIRGFFICHTGMVEKARQIHQLSPVASAALGRSLGATAMMSQMLKGGGERFTLRINGGGPIGTILCVGKQDGSVKGLVDHPQVESVYMAPGKLNVGAVVGTDGELTVIKDLGLKAPYIGTYPLSTGEIAEDLTAYFMHSEQQPSSVGLSVLVDVDYHIKAAGGFILQVMPDIGEEVLSKLEKQLLQLPPLSQLLEQAEDAEELMHLVMLGFDTVVTERMEPRFECDCSRHRMEEALISLGEKELREMIHEDGNAEITCHFCLTAYQFNRNEMEVLLQEALSPGKQ
ncbi:Hsp33 family molecular chaperone HslO [Anoxynatronum sibiricum]|uniref:33 kDa chaperonin n=1 Tax=Anoxynatronum sibiricum TaxID=210623 RepID=A0ABU9VYX9_9CLOT